ncbi:hypothetical protein AB1N83_009187 [Pleurotus pulmonarius]
MTHHVRHRRFLLGSFAMPMLFLRETYQRFVLEYGNKVLSRKAAEDTACGRKPNERSSAPSKEKSFGSRHSILLDLGPLV